MSRLITILIALSIIIGSAFLVSTSANAASGEAFVIDGTNIYMNVWNNGPYISTYDQYTANDLVQLVIESAGAVAIQYVNPGGSYYTGYLGDCGNNSGDARACINTPGSGLPWGANFIQYSCDNGGGTAFWNEHWQAWLAPALPTEDGDAWYLNSSYEACFQFQYS